MRRVYHKKNDDVGPSNINVIEVEQEVSSLTTDNDSECDTDSSYATQECVNESAKLDGHSDFA